MVDLDWTEIEDLMSMKMNSTKSMVSMIEAKKRIDVEEPSVTTVVKLELELGGLELVAETKPIGIAVVGSMKPMRMMMTTRRITKMSMMKLEMREMGTHM